VAQYAFGFLQIPESLADEGFEVRPLASFEDGDQFGARTASRQQSLVFPTSQSIAG
jgi:hypothetical protein